MAWSDLEAALWRGLGFRASRPHGPDQDRKSLERCSDCDRRLCGGRYEWQRSVRRLRWWDEDQRGKWDGHDPGWVGDLGWPITVEFGQVLCVRPPLTDSERAAEQAGREAEGRPYQEVLATFRDGCAQHEHAEAASAMRNLIAANFAPGLFC
jgi:hypothetical protein